MSVLPKISIIIPVFNGEKYIAEAIRTALNQDYTNKEIIVVNDGSVDNTAKICRSFSDNISYFEQSNKGLGASRNQGVILSNGDYFAFLDCDDLWEEEKLTQQMKDIEDEALNFSMIKQFYCSTLSQIEKDKILISQEIMPGYCGSCLLLSRKLFFDIGIFSTTKEVGEFVEWYGRAKALNVRVKVIDKVLSYRRIHLDNMGRQHEKYSRQGYLKVLKRNLDLKRQNAGL